MGGFLSDPFMLLNDKLVIWPPIPTNEPTQPPNPTNEPVQSNSPAEQLIASFTQPSQTNGEVLVLLGYEPRPRHIHFKVKQNESTLLTSQLYFSDDIVEVEGEGM